jgi:N-acetyl-gamma-glutamyl-phosphate reductase
VSGAGKAPSATTHFMYAAENLSAYGIYAHRHTGELVEQLGVCRECITFTPHLLPIQRGILSTIYVSLKDGVSIAELQKVFGEFYAASPMVRMHRAGQLPQIQHVAHTNFCDIGFAVSPEGRRATVVSCLDNLLKGAAGQAVQNMNVVFGFDEAEGLR